jgi:CRISPR-associated protein Cmr6
MPIGTIFPRKEDKDTKWYIADKDKNKEHEVTSSKLFTGNWGKISLQEMAPDLPVEYDMDNKGEDIQSVRRYVPLPCGVRRMLEKYGCGHTGLALDKFAYRYVKQEQARPVLDKTVEVNNAVQGERVLPSLLSRRKATLDALNATIFTATTSSALTLHLARASALENAGICLHPVYGFAYLPGSGVKGMARAYAETVWLPAQENEQEAWRHIEDVFGWAPERDRKKLIEAKRTQKRREREGDNKSPEIMACTGSVVFHDAWPETWPKLFVDITNNHHGKYYQGGKDDAPGDWEDPVPVYFLAVEPGAAFSFALSPRSGAVSKNPSKSIEAQVALAREWLAGALFHLGAGAKTNAGYGCFAPVAETPLELSEKARVVFETTLTLVSPAFLAGASQKGEDCDLRPATLRGLLRWWWRTLHAGFVDIPTLRAMEAAVWGDTKSGGAVRIVVRREVPFKPTPYKKHSKANFTREEKQSCLGIKDCNPELITQGLWYASYGMDDAGRKRYFAQPGLAWKIAFSVRDACYPADARCINKKDKKTTGEPLDKNLILKQAKSALWLLCHFGGVGAKCRKGFGSLKDIEGSLKECQKEAEKFRKQCGVKEHAERDAESPALGKRLEAVEVNTGWGDPWQVLDLVGFAAQSFAQAELSACAPIQHGKHGKDKEALGLPRKIHGPRDDGPIKNKSGEYVQDKDSWEKPVWLGGKHPKRDKKTEEKNFRHAAPVHYHLARNDDGTLTVRVIAFPSPCLPDLDMSTKVLNRLLKTVKTYLETKKNPEKSVLSPM